MELRAELHIMQWHFVPKGRQNSHGTLSFNGDFGTISYYDTSVRGRHKKVKELFMWGHVDSTSRINDPHFTRMRRSSECTRYNDLVHPSNLIVIRSVRLALSVLMTLLVIRLCGCVASSCHLHIWRQLDI